MAELVDIETVQDLTAESRCDEGFVTVRRLRLRHRYADGSFSESYAYDVVDRPGADAVAVLLWAREPQSGRVLVALRHNVRPPVVLRRDRRLLRPDPRPYLTLVEVCAGSLEAGSSIHRRRIPSPHRRCIRGTCGNHLRYSAAF